MPTLIIHEGGRGRRSKTIVGNAILGCAPDCDVVLQGEIARLAEIALGDGRWTVRSLSEREPLYVNGRQAQQVVLCDGDELTVGQSRVVFHLADDRAPEGLWDNWSTAISLDEAEARGLLGAVQQERRRIRPDHEGYLQIAYEISTLRSRSHNVQELGQGVIELVCRITPAESCCILLSESPNSSEALICQDRDGKETSMEVKDAVLQRVLDQGASFFCRDVRTRSGDCAELDCRDRGISSVVAVPLRSPDGVIGALKVITRGRERFGRAEDLQLLAIVGNEAGLAFHNLQSMQVRLQNQRLAAIGRAMSSLADYLRDIFKGIEAGAGAIEAGIEDNQLDAVRSGWERVRSNHLRLSALVQTMLHATEQRPLRRKRQPIKPLVDQVCEMLANKAKSKGCLIESTISDELPWANVDEVALRNALFGLLDNAIDAVPQQTGRVRIGAHATRDRHLYLEITDNGSGLELEELSHVFEAFYTTKAEEGTGIGLFNARKIVQEHEGQISVRSQPGMGSTFTVDLPLPPRQ